jgi:hypothetical protein
MEGREGWRGEREGERRGDGRKGGMEGGWREGRREGKEGRKGGMEEDGRKRVVQRMESTVQIDLVLNLPLPVCLEAELPGTRD